MISHWGRCEFEPPSGKFHSGSILNLINKFGRRAREIIRKSIFDKRLSDCSRVEVKGRSGPLLERGSSRQIRLLDRGGTPLALSLAGRKPRSAKTAQAGTSGVSASCRTWSAFRMSRPMVSQVYGKQSFDVPSAPSTPTCTLHRDPLRPLASSPRPQSSFWETNPQSVLAGRVTEACCPRLCSVCASACILPRAEPKFP